jgi:hypothetical protein
LLGELKEGILAIGHPMPNGNNIRLLLLRTSGEEEKQNQYSEK